MAGSLTRSLLEDCGETLGRFGHLCVHFSLYGLDCLSGDAALDDLHQLLDLCFLLAELLDDCVRAVTASESCIVASFLVAILLSIHGGRLRVTNQNVELFDLVEDVLVVIGQVLSFLASLLLETIIKDIALGRVNRVVALLADLVDLIDALHIEVF